MKLTIYTQAPPLSQIACQAEHLLIAPDDHGNVRVTDAATGEMLAYVSSGAFLGLVNEKAEVTATSASEEAESASAG